MAINNPLEAADRQRFASEIGEYIHRVLHAPVSIEDLLNRQQTLAAQIKNCENLFQFVPDIQKADAEVELAHLKAELYRIRAKVAAASATDAKPELAHSGVLEQRTGGDHQALVEKLERHIAKGKAGQPGYLKSDAQFCRSTLHIDPADFKRWKRGAKPNAPGYAARIEAKIRALPE